MFTTRPVFRGTTGVIAAGHYLAASAGLRAFYRSGNAIDAAATAGFVMAVVEPHLNGIAGEAPILIYSARDNRVIAISGQGPAPAAMTRDKFRDSIPGEGVTAATVPALVDAWLIALREFGTLPLPEVLSPAYAVAEEGWPAQRGLVQALEASPDKHSTVPMFLPVPREGRLIRNPDLARVFKGMFAAAAAAKNRDESFDAARRYFYEGPVAKAIDAHSKALGGFLRADDLAGYHGRIEEPLSTTYRDTRVFKCGPWTQGPTLLEMLHILEGYDVAKLDPAEYLHVWLETAKLAFADRETFCGDGASMDRMLSKSYAEERRRLISDRSASRRAAESSTHLGDTTHVDAADRFGNLVSATPSGGWILSSPIVEGWGFPLGTRGQMFDLDPSHPNALAPGKRPRSTLTPSLAFRHGRPWLAFGTPGGDQQEQWSLQFFLNVVDFRMNLQEAIEAPTVHTLDLKSSFFPRAPQPNRVSAEARIPENVIAELRRRGHDVIVPGPWEHGRVTAVAIEGSILSAAASPRRETAYAVGW